MSDRPKTAPDSKIRVFDGRRAPFAWVDKRVILEKASALGPYALAVYLVLAAHADAGSQTCWPSLGRFARLLGISRKTVVACIRRLEDKGLISVERRRTETGEHESNLYTLLDLDRGTECG